MCILCKKENERRKAWGGGLNNIHFQTLFSSAEAPTYASATSQSYLPGETESRTTAKLATLRYTRTCDSQSPMT